MIECVFGKMKTIFSFIHSFKLAVYTYFVRYYAHIFSLFIPSPVSFLYTVHFAYLLRLVRITHFFRLLSFTVVLDISEFKLTIKFWSGSGTNTSYK